MIYVGIRGEREGGETLSGSPDVKNATGICSPLVSQLSKSLSFNGRTFEGREMPKQRKAGGTEYGWSLLPTNQERAEVNTGRSSERSGRISTKHKALYIMG